MLRLHLLLIDKRCNAYTLFMESRFIRGLRGCIIDLLAEEPGLSSKQLYYKAKGHSVTYQAVHKTLSVMLEEGVVEREVNAYRLSLAWIKDLRRYSDLLESQSQKGAETDAAPVGSFLNVASRTFSLFRKLLVAKDMRLTNDRWLLSGHPVCIFPIDSLVILQKKAQGGGFRGEIYKSAKELGFDWFDFLVRQGKLKHTFEDLVVSGSDTLAMAGWGSKNIDVVSWEKKHVNESFSNALVAELYLKKFGKSKAPVDDFMRGLFAGSAAFNLRDKSFDAVETKCKAKGDTVCLFVGMPCKDFKLGKRKRRELGLS